MWFIIDVDRTSSAFLTPCNHPKLQMHPLPAFYGQRQRVKSRVKAGYLAGALHAHHHHAASWTAGLAQKLRKSFQHCIVAKDASGILL